jgi:hypothetical protein
MAPGPSCASAVVMAPWKQPDSSRSHSICHARNRPTPGSLSSAELRSLWERADARDLMMPPHRPRDCFKWVDKFGRKDVWCAPLEQRAPAFCYCTAPIQKVQTDYG